MYPDGAQSTHAGSGLHRVPEYGLAVERLPFDVDFAGHCGPARSNPASAAQRLSKTRQSPFRGTDQVIAVRTDTADFTDAIAVVPLASNCNGLPSVRERHRPDPWQLLNR